MREIVLDTETTGLSFAEDRVVEIGCIELLDYLPTGRTLHIYVNPQREVPKKASDIHGLTYDFLKKYRTFKHAAPRLLDFIGNDPIIAHNASFDLGMLNGELRRLELPPLANPVIDTLLLARSVKKGGQHNLDALCKHFGIDNSHRVQHGALLDCEILAAVYLELRGGRQGKLELVKEVVELDDLRQQAGPRVFVPRLTEEELSRHRAFIATLGANSVWESWLNPPKPEPASLFADRAERIGSAPRADAA